MAYHFIVNPVATRCPKDIDARIRAVFPRARVRFTERGGDGARLAREVLEAGVGRFDRLIACGGDGTFREVAGVAGGRTTLGVLPAGTVNLVARQLGMPGSLSAALAVLEDLDAVPIYPGRCVIDGRGPGELFFIGVSAGLDADAVHRVTPALKRRLGRWAYVVGMAGRLRHPVTPTVTVQTSGGQIRCGQAVVLKMPAYGGPYVLGLQASLGSPWLEAVTVERGRRAVLGVFWRALLGRAGPGDGAQRCLASRVRLEVPDPGRLQIDGDAFTGRRAELYPHPAPIRVLRGEAR